ncbi:hypothetical protein [Nocardia donostiensis]|uniref:hypothetical protein n=1 Tax=Nocardia donostiensis TaxID=1538463 RepID=UPI0011158029|nr:hypothetical protein [Nocardia donostiensis]
MSATLQQGVANGVLYSIQYPLDDGTVEKVVNTLTKRPSFNPTLENQYQDLNEALKLPETGMDGARGGVGRHAHHRNDPGQPTGVTCIRLTPARPAAL